MTYENLTNYSAPFCLFDNIPPDAYNIPDLPSSVQATYISLAVINGIAAPFTVAVNLLVILAIVKDKELRTVKYNILLSALAFTDLLVGLSLQPLQSHYFACLVQHCVPQCVFPTRIFLPAVTLCVWTILTLTICSIERFLAIQHPMFYLESVTTKRVVLVIVISWIFVPSMLILSITLLLKFGLSELYKFPTAVAGIVCVLIILICNTKVYITARRHRRQINVQQPAIKQKPTDQEQQQLQRRSNEHKLAFTTLMLIMLSIVFYLPHIITAIIQTVKGKHVTDDFKYISGPISSTFISLQSLVNPVVVSLHLSYIYVLPSSRKVPVLQQALRRYQAPYHPSPSSFYVRR